MRLKIKSSSQRFNGLWELLFVGTSQKATVAARDILVDKAGTVKIPGESRTESIYIKAGENRLVACVKAKKGKNGELVIEDVLGVAPASFYLKGEVSSPKWEYLLPTWKRDKAGGTIDNLYRWVYNNDVVEPYKAQEMDAADIYTDYALTQLDNAVQIPQDILTNNTNSDIIKPRVISGARNPHGEKAKEHAEKYYGLVRSMKTDVKNIAKTTGFSEEQIQSVKNFIFYEKHDLGGEVPELFKPDFMMGESWKRLIEGKPELHDITLIKHEIMEQDLIKKGYTQDEAHIITSKKYNYDKEATEFYDKIKKYND